MMYGDPTCTGAVSWLTRGTSIISQWRYDLAMALAFPGIILYGIALYAVEHCILEEKKQRIGDLIACNHCRNAVAEM